MRHASWIIAFALGACTTAAVQSSAEPPGAEPNPTKASAPSHTEAAVVEADAAQRRSSPSGSATITILAHGRNAFVGKLELAAGAAVPEHRDATEEYIHVLSGSGTMMLDGREHSVGPGDTVYMPADALVSYQNGDEPLVAIQIFAGPEPAAKYDGWTTP